MPVEGALFPQINVPDQQDSNVDKHFYEAIDSKAVRDVEHITINVSPGVQKDCFHVKENENHGYQVKLYGEGFTRVAGGLHAALIGFLLGAIGAAPADENRNRGERASQANG